MSNKETKNRFTTILIFLLSVLLFVLLLCFFTNLLKELKIGEWVYLSLVLASFLVAFVVFFGRNIKEINFKEMKVSFEETKKINKEIRQIYYGLINIMAQLNSSAGGSVDIKRVNDIINETSILIGLTPSERNEMLKRPRALAKMMEGKTLNSEEQKEVEKSFEDE